MTVRHLLLVASATIALAVPPGLKAQTTDSSTLRIAFNVFTDARTDDYEIFSMALDGTDRRNISNWKGVDWVYASHGEMIYFLSDRDNAHRKYNLYEMDAYGNRVRRINDFVLLDSWLTSRKAGTEFIVTSAKDGAKAFYLIDSSGKELRKLFSDTVQFNDPCFSPDGNHIAFRYNKSGRDEIWVMLSDGTDLRQVTHYPADQIKENQHIYHAGPPRWNAQQNILSFMSFQGTSYDIYTITPGGTDLRRLTPGGFNYGWHDWSPDGSLIVVDGSDLENKNYDIFLMSSNGNDLKRLTVDSLFEQAPVFVKVPASK